MPAPHRLALLAVPLILASCRSHGERLDRMASEINGTLSAAEPRLAPGDLLSVNFPDKVETWTHETQVRLDGYAMFNSIGDLPVAGLTLPQLNELVREKYSEQLSAPDVTVNVTRWAARKVYVFGEVREPGEYDLEGGRLSLLEAIGRAGGSNRITARLERTLLLRWRGDSRDRLVWKLNCNRKYWGGAPVLLQPYDIVFVPNKGIDTANIWVEQYINRMIPLAGAIGGTALPNP